MNLERWSNIARARESYLHGSAAVDAWPHEAFFEVAARCNLRCQMCAINFDARYRGKGERPPFFEPDLFARLRPIFPTLHRAFLFGLGEPVLNPHLSGYIRELADHGAEVCFNTNATLITEAMAEELAGAGAARVTVSIDGATAATYEAIRRGATFDDVIRGIRALVSASRKYGRPKVDLCFVAMALNIRELPKLVELARELDVVGIHVEPLLAQVGSPDLDEHYVQQNLGRLDEREVSDLFTQSQQRAVEAGLHFGTRFASAARYNYVDEVSEQVRPEWTCSEPWASIWVTSSGEVRTCCINDTSFGNLFEKSFGDIWHGGAFTSFRAQHAAREVAAGCGNCVRNGRMRNSTFFRPTQAVTYRPFFDSVPPPSDADPVTLTRPLASATLTNAIRVSGQFRSPAVMSEFEIVIGHTPVANLGELQLDATSFDGEIAVPYLTEGAHVLWVRRKQAAEGWAHREFYFWRPE